MTVELEGVSSGNRSDISTYSKRIYRIHFPSYNMSSARLSLKIPCKFERCMVMVAYKRWLLTRGSNYSALTEENLVFWISGRLWEVVAHGGLTIYKYTQ